MSVKYWQYVKHFIYKYQTIYGYQINKIVLGKQIKGKRSSLFEIKQNAE